MDSVRPRKQGKLSLVERPAVDLVPAPPKARPFLKWAGGKTKLLPELLKRLPRHYNNYFEPFAGGGALFFELSPRKAFLSDINEELINTYRVIRENLPELLEDLEKHTYSSEYFYKIRNADRLRDFSSWDPIKRASRLIYLNKSCYNGLYRVNARGEFNTPFGDYSNPRIFDRENLSACSTLLKDATLACGSFRVFEQHMKRGDFVYFDPPYVPVSKTANFTGYAKDGFSEDLQISLRDLCYRLTKKGVMFMLSNSYSEFVLESYKTFQIEVVEAPRAINSAAGKRQKVKEVLVSNF